MSDRENWSNPPDPKRPRGPSGEAPYSRARHENAQTGGEPDWGGRAGHDAAGRSGANAGGGRGGNDGDGGNNANAGDYFPVVPAGRNGPVALAGATALDPYRSYGADANSSYHNVTIDYRKYLAILLKHRWLVLGLTGACALLGVVFTLLQTPIYQAGATVQIKREVANLVGVAGLEGVETGRGGEFYQTQYELLKSRALAERVVAKLNLAESAAFVDGSVSSWTELRRLIFGSGSSERDDLSVRQSRAVKLVMEGLSIEPVRASSVVRVSFDSNNARTAQQVANAVVENFIISNLQRTYDATAHARKFLEERLEELKINLQESEKELVAYAGAQQIIVTGQDQSLTSTNLSEASAALGKASRELLRVQTLWEQAQSAQGMGLAQVLENKAIETLRTRRAELAADYQDKLRRFKPDFPEMIQLSARIRELDRQIAAEVDLIKDSLRSQYHATRDEQQSLSRNVEQLKADVMDLQGRNIQYNILKRAVDTNRTLYDGLLQRYKELGVAGGVDANNLANNVSIVDRAEVPAGPYKPRFLLNTGLALMLGLMLGGAAAFVREHFDDTFKTPEELEELLGLPLLGVIPLSDEADAFAQTPDESHSAIAEAYRSLRTALQFSTATGVPKSLLVTSGRPSEGKSTTAVRLARNFAQLGTRVLLIDADMRKPSLHEHLDCDASSGLSNCLIGQVTPPQVFRATDLPNLIFLPCGPLPPNPSELLAGPSMASLLSIACEKFDLVIVDGPPVAGLADAPLLSSMTMGTLLVVEANSTRRAISSAALKRLYFARAQMIGVVMNKFDASKAGFSYGYGYGYGDSGYYGYGAGQSALANTKEPRGWLTFRKRSN